MLKCLFWLLGILYHGIPIKYKGLLYPTSGKIPLLMVVPKRQTSLNLMGSKKREHEGQWPIFRSEELFKD